VHFLFQQPAKVSNAATYLRRQKVYAVPLVEAQTAATAHGGTLPAAAVKMENLIEETDFACKRMREKYDKLRSNPQGRCSDKHTLYFVLCLPLQRFGEFFIEE
jgi:hypothetical protein